MPDSPRPITALFVTAVFIVLFAAVILSRTPAAINGG